MSVNPSELKRGDRVVVYPAAQGSPLQSPFGTFVAMSNVKGFVRVRIDGNKNATEFRASRVTKSPPTPSGRAHERRN